MALRDTANSWWLYPVDGDGVAIAAEWATVTQWRTASGRLRLVVDEATMQWTSTAAVPVLVAAFRLQQKNDPDLYVDVRPDKGGELLTVVRWTSAPDLADPPPGREMFVNPGGTVYLRRLLVDLVYAPLLLTF